MTTNAGAAERRAYVEQLAAVLASRYRTTAADILGQRRFPRDAEPRQLIAYHCREQGWTLVETAEALGRHHSSISHNYERIASRLLVDFQLRDALALLPMYIQVDTNWGSLRSELDDAMRIAEALHRKVEAIDGKIAELAARLADPVIVRQGRTT